MKRKITLKQAAPLNRAGHLSTFHHADGSQHFRVLRAPFGLAGRPHPALCSSALALALTGVFLAGPASATETENRGLRVLPKPGPVNVDGQLGDWDLSGGIFACGQVEHLRDRSSLWLHAMYDAENLYLLARWKDETPLNNPEAIGGHAFNGDCLQFRVIMFPDSGERTVTWWDGWKDSQGRSVVERSSPGPKNGVPDNNMPALKDAQEVGARQAFRVDADGQGYVQELAIPWKLLSVSGKAPARGDRFKFTIEPNFTAGAFGRITTKDIFDDNAKAPDRVFTFRAYKDWGWATLAPAGKVDPQPVRLADARTFPVTLKGNMLQVDWTGLIKKFEWPGFKSIAFQMPADGYVSLNILNSDGKVVRHLLTQDQRQAGPVTVQWDGLTDATFRTPGTPVPPGTYSWKALVHRGAKLPFRGYANYGGNAPWQGTAQDAWLGDHGVPSAVVTDGKRMFLACNGAEGGRHLLATDLQGKVIWGLQNTTGTGDPEHIAQDNGNVYVAARRGSWTKSTALIARVDAATGVYKPWDGRKNHILDAKDVYGGEGGPDLTGIDALAGTIYGTNGASLLVLDGNTGALKSTFPLADAGALKVRDAGTAYVICGSQVRQVDLKDGSSKVFLDGLIKPQGITVDAAGRVLVSLGAPVHQVAVYDAAGKPLGLVGQTGGRGLGKWQPERMFEPAGLAVDPEGKLWVMEHDFHPKRVSVWNLGGAGIPVKTQLVRDYFGPSHYGSSGGAVNPRDPDIMVGEGCEWRIDANGGPGQCLGTFDRKIHNFAAFREGSNGKLYLVTLAMRYGNGLAQVWERRGDADYVLRAELNNQVQGADEKLGATTLWVDANGDGQRQPEETQQRAGALYVAGSNSWSVNLGPDLAFYAFDKGDGKLKLLKPAGFTAAGTPRYDLSQLQTLPEAMSVGYRVNYSCAVPDASNKTLLMNLEVKDHPAKFLWHGFDLATGKLRWTYPNPYFQVHGSHKAPAPEPGLFRGAYGPVGTANLPGVGDFWAINGNLGEWWTLSTDGFFVSRVFNGNVFDWKWPEKSVPGYDFMSLPAGSGGEDFGGSMTQGRDGKVYVQAGKSALWNLRLDGLENAVTLSGNGLVLTEEDTRKAQGLREAALQAAAAGGKVEVKRQSVTLTGNLNADFKGVEPLAYQKSDESAVKTAMAWDDNYLYVGWQVKDNTPWINGAQDISQMYASGDTVDLQLATDPAAPAKRNKPVKGDLRLSIGNFQGTPTAVLYRWMSDTKQPRAFSSGVVQGYQVEYVDVVPDVSIQVKKANDGYTVEAAIPLSVLGLKPGAPVTLRGDVGVTHGDTAGVRTRLRTYWSNQETGLVDDVVFELQPAPGNWGEIVLK